MSALVVEDDESLANTLVQALIGWGANARHVTTVRSALLEISQSPSIVILDVRLPDGSGLVVAEQALRRRPSPLVVAMSGNATAKEAFRLAEMGVRGYLPKPLSLSDFTNTLEALLDRAPEFVPQLVANVGHAPFREVLSRVRYAMTAQALALSGGSRSGAARVLGVTRQAVQQLIHDLGIDEHQL